MASLQASGKGQHLFSISAAVTGKGDLRRVGAWIWGRTTAHLPALFFYLVPEMELGTLRL